MYVEFGNSDALEGYRDATSDDPDKVRYRQIEGQRVTTVNFPDGMSLQEAFSTAITVLGYHMQAGAAPTFIESDSVGLQSLLEEHYAIPASKNSRPKTWGRDTGVVSAARSGNTGEDV